VVKEDCLNVQRKKSSHLSQPQKLQDLPCLRVHVIDTEQDKMQSESQWKSWKESCQETLNGSLQ
jgi:hypothetical protein